MGGFVPREGACACVAVQHCLQHADWARAEELARTEGEREDLAYLREREQRVGSSAIAE